MSRSYRSCAVAFLAALVFCCTLISPAAAQSVAASYNSYYQLKTTTQLHASFGTAPYSYELVSGALPPGTAMDSTGKITGSPSTRGTYQFVTQVTDSSPAPVTQTLTYKITVALKTDTYGGLVNLPSPNGATGFFRLEKTGGRWNFITPLGNRFWMNSVYVANNSFLDPSVINNKYHGSMANYETNRGHRMLSWGFNTLGEYTAETGLPVTTYGSTAPSTVKMPFVMLINTIVTAASSPSRVGLSDPLKSITNGVPATTFTGYRGILTDVFDPKFQQAYQAQVNYFNQTVFKGGFASIPWIVGITTDDADYLWALKSAGSKTTPYPHPVFLIATTNFQYGAAQNPNKVAFQDPTLYSKLAWSNFLQQEYGTIAALNAAWGSNYTSFGDNGGFGVGTGLLDEDGRHTAWIGTDAYNLSNTATQVKADMDAFLYQFAYQYASVAVNTIRSVDKNHLIFGPVAINSYGVAARPQVLKAFADAGMSALSTHYDSINQDMSGNREAYDATGLPMMVWYDVHSNPDSPLQASTPLLPRQDFPTQEARAAAYNTDLANFYNAEGSNGDHYILGINWWELTDGYSGEHTNWGLTTIKDNAYDGKEDVVAAHKDKYGYTTGGEARNYGDFLTGVTSTNFNTYQQLIDEQMPLLKKK